MRISLRGIIPPLVTPLTDAFQLDVPALERVIERVVAGGVHGIFVLGTTGEATSLPEDLRRQLIRRAIQTVARRVPVVVGVTDTVVAQGISLAQFAADEGADAVVVSAPYYVPPSQPELIGYVSAFVARQPLPVVLYNIPHLTKAAFAPETVRRLAQMPRVIGMKDSAGDLAYFESIRTTTDREDFAFLIGHEPLLADGLARGAHGAIPSGANLAPREFVRLFEAVVGGSSGRDEVTALFERVKSVRGLYTRRPGASGVIRSIKGALACLGVCGPQVAPPYESCTEGELDDLRRQMGDLELR